MGNSAISFNTAGLASTTSPGLVGTGAQTFAGAKTFQDGLIPPQSMMFRNKFINGGFDIWQRGTSQTSAGYGSDDRWSNGHNGSTKTASRQTFALGQTDVPGNPKYWARTVVTSVAGASNFVSKHQVIENVLTLSGQQFTISFWAKADASKNIAVEMVQYFGTGGSPSATVTGLNVTTVALTSSWSRYTVSGTLPSVSGKTLGTNNDDGLVVYFWFDAGSSLNARTNSLGQHSGTFDIANVQLEAGPVATPFEQRPIGTELALCQRYYEKLDAGFAVVNNIGSIYQSAPFNFTVVKRSSATLSVFDYAGNANKYSTYSTGVDSISNNAGDAAVLVGSDATKSFRLRVVTATSGTYNIHSVVIASAEL